VQSHLPTGELDPEYLNLSSQLDNVLEGQRKPLFKKLSLDRDLTNELMSQLQELHWTFAPGKDGTIEGRYRNHSLATEPMGIA
jgi:hypothetical protein